MHQTTTESVPGRDPMIELQKQKEKLQLIEQECVIEWTQRSIAASKGKLSRLSGELTKLNQSLQALQGEKETKLAGLSQQDAWTKLENQMQTLKLLDINSKIRDAEAAIEQVRQQTIDPTKDIEQHEHNARELKDELKEATQKWHTRWPEQEECCMVLKLELSRTQAELNATYKQIEAQFAAMAPVKVDHTLIDAAPCQIFPPRIVVHKNTNVSKKVTPTASGDLIVLGDEVLRKQASISVMEVEGDIELLDLLTGYDEDKSTTEGIAMIPDNSGILIDLSTEEAAEILEVPRASADLAVLITDFPIWCEPSKSQDLPAQTTIFRNSSDIVQALSKGYGQLIKNRFESTKVELAHKKTEIERLGNQIQLMQPLFNVGLAIRQRRLEVDTNKPNAERDIIVIGNGNCAAHHADSLADATFMMAPPLEKRFRELYNGVPPSVVWEHRGSTVFLDMLNWKLDMKMFSPQAEVDKKIFNQLFDSVFPRIYPSLKTCNKMFEQEWNLRASLAGMKAEHGRSHERDAEAHRMQRGFLKAQRRTIGQAQTN